MLNPAENKTHLCQVGLDPRVQNVQLSINSGQNTAALLDHELMALILNPDRGAIKGNNPVRIKL